MAMSGPARPFGLFTAVPPLRVHTTFRRSVSTFVTTLHDGADLPDDAGANFTVFGKSGRVSVETTTLVAPPSASACTISPTYESFAFRSTLSGTSLPATYSLFVPISFASFRFPSGLSSKTYVQPILGPSLETTNSGGPFGFGGSVMGGGSTVSFFVSKGFGFGFESQPATERRARTRLTPETPARESMNNRDLARARRSMRRSLPHHWRSVQIG